MKKINPLISNADCLWTIGDGSQQVLIEVDSGLKI